MQGQLLLGVHVQAALDAHVSAGGLSVGLLEFAAHRCLIVLWMAPLHVLVDV